jgi:hypothetical protein
VDFAGEDFEVQAIVGENAGKALGKVFDTEERSQRGFLGSGGFSRSVNETEERSLDSLNNLRPLPGREDARFGMTT